MIKILFFTHAYQDYLSDSLLHGLKSLEGVKVYDYPRKNVLYKNGKDDYGITGNGMTLYYLLDDDQLNRFGFFYPMMFDEYNKLFDDWFNKKYDLVIISNISHQFGYYLQYLPHLKKKNTVIIDGEDTPALFPYYGYFWRRPLFWFIPRPHKRFIYYKREWTIDTKGYMYYKFIPKSLLKFLPDIKNIRPISFAIPEEKIVKTLPKKTKLFPTHIVDEEVADKVEGSFTKYAFKKEVDYYSDLQTSKFGITTKRSGWDCLRHYEIAANGAVMCFKDLHKKPTTCAPHGLIPGINCISYTSYDNLLGQISNITDTKYDELQQASLVWVKDNTTVLRAKRFLSSFKLIND
jgi:hypothetical protein